VPAIHLAAGGHPKEAWPAGRPRKERTER
jgi:hypothetical protein